MSTSVFNRNTRYTVITMGNETAKARQIAVVIAHVEEKVGNNMLRVGI